MGEKPRRAPRSHKSRKGEDSHCPPTMKTSIITVAKFTTGRNKHSNTRPSEHTKEDSRTQWRVKTIDQERKRKQKTNANIVNTSVPGKGH